MATLVSNLSYFQNKITIRLVIPAIKNYISEHIFSRSAQDKDAAEAYDLWSEDYDLQPGNLMLDLDEKLFTVLLGNTNLRDKAVADIGCGTGRHWNKILEQKPLSLTGFDVSAGMLGKLKEKFPEADVHQIKDDLFTGVPCRHFDIIVSTLTVAHIENIDDALNTWCSLLKPDAEIIITDFHPRLLAFGGKRTFKHGRERLSVKNYAHQVHSIKNLLYDHGFSMIREEEYTIDPAMKHYYEAQNALAVYEQFKGYPVIYGIHLKRGL